MTPQQIVQRAERARQLLEDPLLVESLDMIEREILDQWEACPARDVEGRELLWRYYKNAKKFRGILQGVVQSGQLAVFRETPTFVEKTLDKFRR